MVLVVDDEALVRMNAVDILEDAGFDTCEAGSVAEAMARFKLQPDITVLFTDINMPGRHDGLELARWVHGERPDVQLIVTSGREAPQAGKIPDGGRFIAKPYDSRVLTDLVNRARK